MDAIYSILDELQSSHEEVPSVLATIIKVEGSAYRKEGAAMLIKNERERVGLLSAGCLEEDLIARIQRYSSFQESETLQYDMSSEDDLSWGQGAGCNGILHILLEPVNPSFRDHLLTLKTYLQAGLSVDMIRLLDNKGAVSQYLFIAENGFQFGNWQTDKSQIHKVLDEQKAGRQDMKNRLMAADSSSTYYFFQTFQPKSRLILFGAGEDAEPLAQFASQAGFSVWVTDWRTSRCHPSHFPKADQLIVGSPKEIANQLTFNAHDSVILLSHVFQKDREFLQHLQDLKLKFLGLLGSKDRTKRLLKGLELMSSIYSPVGLPIGAEGPEEIAISIVAQLIQVKRSSVHDPAPYTPAEI
ncbi:XdhC family protein [Pullulanibacillus sp. KACC 23026]|uniref:XdhC family protein n=1 Tax=Pullulanibacillus sp. KACC 23026 TaxID=3028315 RepID=UPI0023B14FB4|nr:XdhC family protein [Pullulanibacillus sp. KACC 23026]WEG14809.1 XdhC family protein [Pullulanibacillus sp. KACC 23026]